MAENYPVGASGSREPEKRPKPIPKVVREAIKLMVYGDPDDADGKPLSFIEAGKTCGIRPDTMRRYLDRPAVRALLRAERRAFREAISAGNEFALLRVRDGADHGNPMARIQAVRTLEQIADAEPGIGPQQTAGVTINILHPPASHAPAIDVSPTRIGPALAPKQRHEP